MTIRKLLAPTLVLLTALGQGGAWANPIGGTVAQGSASFDQRGNLLTIINTPGTIINWQGFSIAAGETTRFIQRDAASAVLNRIVGQDPSRIFGALQSNGRVFLVNPNGVLFGAGAQVDVAGLVASSLDIANDDFRSGKLAFAAQAGSNPGGVRNQGAITTPGGGQVFLIAPSVENSGLISSPQGEVVLAAGRQVQLVDSRHPDLHVVVSAPGDQALNLGQVIAQGGAIGIYGALVNQRGVVNADSAVVGENGRVVFRASDTTLVEAGSVTSARGAGVGVGGSIHVLGDRVGITGDASVDASGNAGGGTVLVGGDYRGANAAIANASATYVGAETSIRADAIDSGNGGRVIVWADGPTHAYGQISARGGQLSGNGGFAEVSGAGYLDFRGRADLRAPQGTAGTLLLDPNDITIQAAGSTDTGFAAGPPNATFSGGTGSSILTVTDLVAQLGMGHVVVSTASGTGGPSGGRITVADPIAWNGGFLTLDADNGIAINAAITSQLDGRLILVNRGGAITQTAPINVTYLNVTSLGDVVLTGATNMVTNLAAQIGDGSNLNRNFSFVNGQTLNVHSLGGLTGIAVATSGAYSPGAPGGVISLRTTSGDITQSSGSLLVGHAVNAQAHNVMLTEPNQAPVVSGTITGAGFFYTSASGLTVGSVAGTSGIQAAGDVNLTALAGDLALGSAVTTGGGVAMLTASGAINGNANALIISAAAGDGIALTTQTQSLQATNAGGAAGITIANSGSPLTVNTVTDGGTGPISITNAGPLTVNGVVSSVAGAITLAAGPTGNATDVLTVNGGIAANPGPGVVVSTTGPILLRAGNAINVSGTITGAVTQQAMLNVPTLAECIANRALPGCDTVLPTVAQCGQNPALPGCPTPVLPTLAQCIATPTLSGCSRVLPTVDRCTASPTLAGCSAVLPSIVACVTTPTLPGCAVVLPLLNACIVTPSLAGCSVVLPSLAACIATPSAAGCSAVLPTTAQCISAPALPGCAVVLPTLAQCVAVPALPGCAVVLPTLTQCTATPTLPGCSVVLPALAQCVATPSLPGCTVVLPGLTQCTATPTLPGCSVVLPTLTQCTGSPTLQGCSAVLPPISACAANPTAPGCLVVVPPTSNTPPNSPVTTATNNTVNIINTSTSSGSGSTGASPDSAKVDGSKTEEKKEDKDEKAIIAAKPGAKNEPPPPKTYCN